MGNFKKALIILMVLFLQGCGQPSGVAPSLPPQQPAPLTPYESLIKNGETKVTSGGWTVSIDTTDSIQTTGLANGWVVEDIHE